MAIAKKPKSNHPPAEEQRAKQFIEREPAPAEEIKVPIMMRISPSLLKRVDRAARRLGISRSPFMVSSAATRVELMEKRLG